MRRIKYIFMGLMWCLVYTVVNLLNNKTDFMMFMQTESYKYNVIIYFTFGIIVAYVIELRLKNRAKKS